MGKQVAKGTKVVLKTYLDSPFKPQWCVLVPPPPYCSSPLTTHTMDSCFPMRLVCVCVCVCEREREARVGAT
jgi:hypothetical protein